LPGPTEEGARVWSGVGNSGEKLANSWHLYLTQPEIPAGGKVTIYATDQQTGLSGQTQVMLPKDRRVVDATVVLRPTE
jgi:hypothetical protein